MAELSKLVEQLLENPDTGKKLSSLLGSLQQQDEKEPESPAPFLPDSLDADMLMKITKAMSALGNMKEDRETRLLYDLKPYISGARQKRVDEAVQILRLLRVIDIIGKEQLM